MYINLKEAEGLSFSNCDNCQTSCCDGGRFILAPLVLADLAAVYEKFLIAFAYIDGNLRLVMLISNREKSCIYYEDGRCSIYDKRPPACVIYPFTPFYDDVYVDTACEAVGIVGFELKQAQKHLPKQVHPAFYHKRLEGFSQKFAETEMFLERLDDSFEVMFEIEGVSLMFYSGMEDNEFLKMHKASLKYLTHWID